MGSVTKEDENEFRKKLNTQRATRVKNKAPAPIQITAEQLLREAQAQQSLSAPRPPKQRIIDPEEAEEYKYRKRKGYEDAIRRNRANIGAWVKYATWEESQMEFERARSVFERALDIDYRAVILWLKYAEMEMKQKNINAARNVWDRAVTLLPRVDQLWLKYSYMEDIMGNYAGARQIFERWMEWEPAEAAWLGYIRFELRCGEIERARQLYRRFVQVHPNVTSWLRWARFEERYGSKEAARAVFEEAIEFLGSDANDERLFIAFATFEEKCKEVERCRAIYKYALDHIPKGEAQALYKKWISFEKTHGDRGGIEEVIIGKRRFQYEETLKSQPLQYDTWFDYLRLEETYGDVDRVRELYERAIAQRPPVLEKRAWRRYIYLWIYYALFEELEAKDIERTRQVYKECIKTIPHSVFSFAKVWRMFALFEVRQKNLAGARSVFGHALGMAPKDKLFQEYVQLELQIGNVDRCRAIYERWLQWRPAHCPAWVAFAHLERDLGEIERSRGIFELAISQPILDSPEILWKEYIDFEIDQEEYGNARALYKRLLERTKHVKVWLSFAQFEASIGEVAKARQTFAEAYEVLKDSDKEERVTLVESWKEWEEKIGDAQFITAVEQKLPKRIVKKRPVVTEDGMEAGWEEYYDYLFPGEETAQSSLKLLERARLWKKQMEQ